MQHNNYKCPNCGNRQYETDEFRATGGFWSKIFDVQNKKFTTVSCAKCTYTGIYETDSSLPGNFFDFLTE